MIILEGTDAVGKTTIINKLIDYEIKDRDSNVCRLIDFDVSLKERVEKLNNYFSETNNVVIFLINNDKDELERRVNQRPHKDEYDRYAYIYNLLYLETYLYMKQNSLLNEHLYMIDLTGLTIEEGTFKVKSLIEQIKVEKK